MHFGLDCNLYSVISEAAKGKTKSAVETTMLEVHEDKNNTREKTAKVEKTIFQKKDPKKSSEAKESATKSKVTTNSKSSLVQMHSKQDFSSKKIAVKDSSGTARNSRPTVVQVLMRHEGRKKEEARKDKTAVLVSKKVLHKPDVKVVKERTASKTFPKSDQLRDEPQTNATQSSMKSSNGTSKIVTILSKGMGTNKTKAGHETMEQSTLAEKNVTQSFGNKEIKKVKVENTPVQSLENRNTEARKPGKEKVTQKSHHTVKGTTAATSGDTAVHGSGRRIGGSGLGSVKVVNISSYSFTVTWSAPQGMFKNFTVVRREPLTEDDQVDPDDFEEEDLEGDQISTAKNTTESRVQVEGTNTTAGYEKAVVSKGKSETKRISMVVPGNVRSVEFSNLRPNTGYVLHIYGAAAQRKSKIHRVTAVTGKFCLIADC